MSPSDSIKVVPGRSKFRVESSNPVPTGNSVHRPSKVRMISPQEAMELTTGVAPMPLSPPRRASRAAFGPPVPALSQRAPEPAPRPILRSPSDLPRPSKAPHVTFAQPVPVVSPQTREEVPGPEEEPRRRKTPRVTSELPRSEEEPLRPEEESRRRKTPRVASDLPRRQIVCALPASSTSSQFVRRRSNPSRVPSKTVEPPLSPRALQILSRIKQYAPANATPVVQGTVEAVEATADATPVVQVETVEATAAATPVVQGSKEIPDSSSKRRYHLLADERVPDLVEYRPALFPTWNGKILHSATTPEVDYEFWSKPASSIRKKARKLSTQMPKILNGELLPAGPILKDVFGRSPSLSDVAIYFFPDDKDKERFIGEHAHLFESSDMIRLYVKGRQLLIFSSRVLDTTSQYLVNIQKRTETFLWGCFLPVKNPQPASQDQADKVLDDTDAVGMDSDAEYLTSQSTPVKNPQPLGPDQADNDLDDADAVGMDSDADHLTSQYTPSTPPDQVNREVPLPPPGFENLSRSPVRVKTEAGLPPGFENPSRAPADMMSELSVPPGYENVWATPLVKLNIQGTSNPAADLSGFAGLVRDLSGKWLFGYTRCHRSMPELTAGLLAIYNGLSLLWDSGFRDIRLETTNSEITEALTTNSKVFLKKNSILDRCRDLILRDWNCDIYLITKEQNSCAEWLASRLEQEVQGLVFYKDPPRGLINLLEEDRLAAEEAQPQ